VPRAMLGLVARGGGGAAPALERDVESPPARATVCLVSRHSDPLSGPPRDTWLDNSNSAG